MTPDKRRMRDLDVALAVEARAMYAHMLRSEGIKKAAACPSADELIALLKANEAWGEACAGLPETGCEDRRLLDALHSAVAQDALSLYSMAGEHSREVLRLFGMEAELRELLSALRRLSSPLARELEPLPRSGYAKLPGCELGDLSGAKTFAQLTEMTRGSVYYDTMKSMELSAQTGLPVYSRADVLLENRLYQAEAEFLERGYRGPDSDALREMIGLRADILNISYALRLRRFGVPAEEAKTMFLPLHGSVDTAAALSILEAGSVEAAVEAVRSTKAGKWVRRDAAVPVSRLAKEALRTYYLHALRTTQSIASVCAFLFLKRDEAETVGRIYVALEYGANAEEFI